MANMKDALNKAFEKDGNASRQETDFCRKLAEAGEEMDTIPRTDVRETIGAAGEYGYWAALIVHGFVWAGLAVP